MLKWIESTGKSEEAAIEAALQKLGMDRDEVSVEILERAKSGFLGIGSCPAKVKVSYEAPGEPRERPAQRKLPLPRRSWSRRRSPPSGRRPLPPPPPWPRGRRRSASTPFSPACWPRWGPRPDPSSGWMKTEPIRWSWWAGSWAA
ncbi:MAG: Jag N-terminal domain-containing protein [Flavonifractor plautii]